MRKTIAVCVTGYDYEYESRVVEGVYKACQKQDINLLVFASLLRKPDLILKRTYSDNIIHGETEIFNLMNYDMVDGIIMLGDSFITTDVIDNIEAHASAHHIPVVNINDPVHEADINILLSDSVAMEFVVNHLIEKHGVRRLNFIGGFPGNLQTEERLSAYKKVLEEHNIPVEEKRIGYGEFWIKANDVTRDFLSGPKEEWPEAIVCASDTMAIFCMDTLKSMGIKVPEDMLVTGFDGIKDGEFCKPSLTTVRRAFFTAGEVAVRTLKNVWEGAEVDSTIYVESELVTRESCGCSGSYTEEADYIKKYEIKNRFIEFNTYILKMNSNFGNVSDSKELYLDTVEGAKYFGLKQMFLCLRSDMENEKRSLEQENKGILAINMPRSVVSMVEYGHTVPVGTEFDSKNMIPIDLYNREKPVFYAFSSLYFKDNYLGYMAYEPGSVYGISGDLFATWILQISNNAGSFYMKNELQYVVNKLRDLNERDPLTGLYNRRGMNHNKALVENAVKNGDIITVVCADVDNLKKINDNFGHEGGDTVIMRTAMALSQALPANAVCVRTGGDEFCAVFSHSDTVSVEKLIRKIDLYLNDFNDNSGLPYKAACSCGYVSERIDNVEDIENMVKEADERMYRIKVAKKAVRLD